MPRRDITKTFSLDEIHQAINCTIRKRIEDDMVESSSISLEDALQSIDTIPRPKSIDSIEVLGRSIFSAIDAAGEDPQSWKLLALTIIRKRYHAKAPTAKELRKNQEGSDRSDHGEGHGERLSFYLLCVYLQIMARESTPSKASLAQTCECLGRLALFAGGTRDVCALIEHLVYDKLHKVGVLQIQKDKGGKRALCQAVLTVVFDNCSTKEYLFLEELLGVAATLLDEDLKLVDKTETAMLTSPAKKKIEQENTTKPPKRKFQSTINTFIPHHDRGTKSRKLVQSVAELMIWSKTDSCKSDPKFTEAIKDLCQYSSSQSDESNDDKIIALVHSTQTLIRRSRKQLNSSSRAQGFSLWTAFTIDPASITHRMIKGGKDGDVQKLLHLASKARDTRIMGLISNRYSDPSKAVPISSLSQLQSTWIDVDCEVNEFSKVQLEIQNAVVKATIDVLQSKITKPTDTDRKHIIASIDDTTCSDVAAILIAAAFDSQCVWESDTDSGSDNGGSVTLKIGKELCSTSTGSHIMKLLNEAFAKKRSSTVANEERRTATTKEVQNLIERHVIPGSQVILFASTDVQLEPRVLNKLQAEKSTIHCHVDDMWSTRMKREKAKIGDITVTLAWDNECDLDLHAICPNGDHISYSTKQGGGEKGGGYLDVDMNAGGQLSMEPVENIFFGDEEKGIEAAHGKYKIFVQNYAYHGKSVANGDPVSWRVRLSKDAENTEFSGECVGTMEKSNVTVIEFEYEGRTAPLPETVGSALLSSKLIGVTSSVGSTLDSLSGLMRLSDQNEVINQVQELASNPEEERLEDAAMIDSDNDVPDNTEMETRVPDDTEMETRKRIFHITNRDRLYINLSTLPGSFHTQVNQSIQGGETLIHFTASQLAKRLIKDNIHIDELKKAGYQDTLISIVKDKMVTFGL